MRNKLLSELALVRKMSNFCADLSRNFESICLHMVEKFNGKDAKKGPFNNQMGFRKKSNKSCVVGDAVWVIRTHSKDAFYLKALHRAFTWK